MEKKNNAEERAKKLYPKDHSDLAIRLLGKVGIFLGVCFAERYHALKGILELDAAV